MTSLHSPFFFLARIEGPILRKEKNLGIPTSLSISEALLISP